MFDVSGLRGVGREGQRSAEHFSLLGRVIDVAVGATEGMLDGGDARHADESLVNPDHVEGHSGDTGFLDLPCDQSHGFVTYTYYLNVFQ